MKYMLEKTDKEIKRAYIEDFEDFTDSDCEIAQGVLGRQHCWIETVK